MAAEYKVLGQHSVTVADTLSDLYIVPAGKSAVTSTLVICNRGPYQPSFRLAVRPAGAAIADKHWIIYDSSIELSDSLFLTLGLTLAETDAVSVRTSATGISFSLFGSEQT